MGTFAETANVDYRLLLANQGKQTSFFRFRSQKTNGSLPFPFSCKQTEVAIFQMVVCRFRFPANKRKFPFSVSSVFRIYILYMENGKCIMYIYIYIYLYRTDTFSSTYIHTYILPFQKENGRLDVFP